MEGAKVVKRWRWWRFDYDEMEV